MDKLTAQEAGSRQGRIKKSRQSQVKQQPGKYLCVDTRKQPDSVEVATHAREVCSRPTQPVQPDSLCKLKTILAINCAKDILKSAQTTNDVPKRTKTPKRRTNGQLKPLLGRYSNAGSEILTCVEVQNGRFKKSVPFENRSEISLDSLSQASTRFSRSSDLQKVKIPEVDLRRVSLVDCSVEMEEEFAMHDEVAPNYYKDHELGGKTDDLRELKGINSSRTHFHWCGETYEKMVDENNNNNNNNNIDPHEFSDETFCNNGAKIHKNDAVKHSNRTFGKLDDLELDTKTFSGQENISKNTRSDHTCISNVAKRSDEGRSCSALHEFQQINTKKLNKNEASKSIKYYNHDFDDFQEFNAIDKKTSNCNGDSNHPVTLSTIKVVQRSQNQPKNDDLYDSSDENNRFGQRVQDSQAEHHNPKCCATYGATKHTDANPRTSDLDSIQVKDIWKALNDSGFNISREEVSKYKVNTSRTRVKSAPASRTTPWAISSKNLPITCRTKSAHGFSVPSDSVSTVSSDPTEECCTDKGGARLAEKTRSMKVKIDNCPPFQENLDVVGITKPVSVQPRKMKMVAPLSFKINTRPKPGHFFYFSYGLNMNKKRLEIQLRCKTGVKYWGLLFGFRLLFNKKGSSDGGVAFPNVVADPGFSVEGCVYELPQDCLPLLDICSGFPEHYSRIIVPVWLCNSENPDEHGVAQHCVPSVIYIAQNDWVVSDPARLDSSFTMKQCFLGTEILTPCYQEYFKSLMKY